MFKGQFESYRPDTQTHTHSGSTALPGPPQRSVKVVHIAPPSLASDHCSRHLLVSNNSPVGYHLRIVCIAGLVPNAPHVGMATIRNRSSRQLLTARFVSSLSRPPLATVSVGIARRNDMPLPLVAVRWGHIDGAATKRTLLNRLRRRLHCRYSNFRRPYSYAEQ